MIKSKKKSKTDIMKRIIQNGVKVHKYQNRQERELNFSKELKGYEEQTQKNEERKVKQKEEQKKKRVFYY